MHDLDVLRDLAIIVGLAIPIVALAHRVRLPPLVAFLLTGVVIGPSGAGLIPDPEAVSALSEIGVVLLLFAIGLELSLSEVLRWGRSVIVSGGSQAAGMIGLVAAAGAALGAPPGRSLFYGFLAVMSSTAVVTRAFADRGELDTPAGRESVSILLFQDLCVVPFMLLVPLLAGQAETSGGGLWLRVAGGLAVVAALVVGGRTVVRWALDRVVLVRDRELFTLCVGFLAIATALVTAGVGFSLAIGAFLAGLIISESEYGLQALSDVLPFRALFSGVFFTSIGMLLDVPLVVGQPLVAVGATLALIGAKTAVTAGAVMLRGRSLDVSLMTGLSLAQVGEFSFVLAAAGLPLGLFAGDDYQFFLSVAALSMMVTPFLVATARPAADAVVRRLPARRRRGASTPAEPPAEAAHGHAVIVGYGVAGRYLTRMLQAAGITAVVIDQNAELVRLARDDGPVRRLRRRDAARRAGERGRGAGAHHRLCRVLAGGRAPGGGRGARGRTRRARRGAHALRPLHRRPDAAWRHRRRRGGVRGLARALRAGSPELTSSPRRASPASSTPCGESTTGCCAAGPRPTSSWTR